MQLTTVIAALSAAGAALAHPVAPAAPAARSRSLDRRDDPDVLLHIMPLSKSCDNRGPQCRTAAQAAPLLLKGMQDYGIDTGLEQAGILALVAYESVEMQFSKNTQHAAEGQGTSNMQQGHYNLDYAKSIPALAGQAFTTSNILDTLTDDKYNFGSGPWFYSTQCKDAQAQKQAGPDAWFQAYMKCVGVDTTAQPQRIAYWNSAKEVFHLA